MFDVLKKNQSILIIDDDMSILKILAKILQKQGYNIDTAGTGADALKKLEAKHYDVALIDVKLPDISGIDLLNQIQNIATDMIKIVMTGYPSDEDREKAIARGADEYLAKPVKSEKLIAIIQSKLEEDCEPIY